MINCPNCGGLNPQTSSICGACGASLTGVNNNVPTNNGAILYENDTFNSPVNTKDIKDKHGAISIWHIVLFVISVLSYIYIPIRIAKLGLAFVFFYIAESSNHKNSVFLILVRIITAIQILGFVIALVLRVFVGIDAMNEFFIYFRF